MRRKNQSGIVPIDRLIFVKTKYILNQRFVEVILDLVNDQIKSILERGNNKGRDRCPSGAVAKRSGALQGTLGRATDASFRPQHGTDGVPRTGKHYTKELMAEVNADREAHGNGGRLNQQFNDNRLRSRYHKNKFKRAKE